MKLQKNRANNNILFGPGPIVIHVFIVVLLIKNPIRLLNIAGEMLGGL